VRRADDGSVLGYQGIVRDVTETKKLETQLRQAHKIEAIGTLAGGIAHDFNNILTAIIGYTELTREDLPEGSRMQSNMQEVLKAGIRARDLIGHIMAFSRQDEGQRRPVQIGLIVKEVLKLLRASLPTTIDIRQDIKSQSDLISGDPTEIHQVLMNLSTNAGHAMREKGGVLEVRLVDEDLDAGAASQHPDLKPGPYLTLTVSDTGCGMDPEVMERIFEPYFTTKEVGEGTGMGLAVVYGIVESHGGAVTVDSTPGKGTTFQVFFPIIQTEEVEEVGIVEPLPTGRERVLFVDDEKALVDIGKQILERLGYEVAARTSSIEALEAFKAQPHRFDLVITDQTMPNMTGEDLAKELMRIRPDISVILCTGYSHMISEDKAKAMGIRGFIMKPILRRDIAYTIRRVLDQKDEKVT
jgi:nitrogen-specific signal transduction histidine kinase/ActR/RegA family two-component response regulator